MPVHDAPGNGTPAVAVTLGMLAAEVVGPGVAAGGLKVTLGGGSAHPARTTDVISMASVNAQRRTSFRVRGAVSGLARNGGCPAEPPLLAAHSRGRLGGRQSRLQGP